MLGTPRSSRQLFPSVASPSFLARAGNAAKQLVSYAANPYVPVSAALLYPGKKRKSPPKKKRKTGVDKVRFSESNGTGQAITIAKKKRSKKKSKGSIKKRVAKLEKETKLNYQKATFKFDYAFQAGSLTNTAGYTSYHWMSGADILTTVDEMPYYDPTSPATKSQTNMGVASNPTKLQMKFVGSATMRNNYLYPAELDVYIVRPKSGTADSPTTDIQDGINNAANISVATWAQYNLFPSDSKLFAQKWKILKHQKVRLQSGDELTISHSEKFTFDNKLYADSSGEGNLYTKQYSRVLLIRLCGVVAHESADPTLIGIAPSYLDVLCKRMYTVSKPSEAPMVTLQQTKNTTVTNLTTAVVGVSSAERETSAS
jgi:hypothetical protein